MENKITAYLKRIGYMGTPTLDFDTLHALQRHHLQSVPYENIDIIRGVPISLDLDTIYDKIVTRHRGGYCFELNALFAWLLRELGFDVKDYFARFLLNETTIPMRRHHVLGVSFGDEQYLCDVGVGLVIPRKPILLAHAMVSEQDGETFLLSKQDFLGYVVSDLRDGQWRQMYCFTEEEQIKPDFEVTSYWCEHHPDSIFNKSDMVHIFTENGRKSVAGREVRLYMPEGVTVINPATAQEYEALLAEHFGIRI